DGHDRGGQYRTNRPPWHRPGWRGQHLRRELYRQQHHGLRGGGERERDADGRDRGRQHGAKPSGADHILARSAAAVLPRLRIQRASLARLVLLVQRLLDWNLAAVLIHVMDIERSIRMQEERTRSTDAGELVHMFDG